MKSAKATVLGLSIIVLLTAAAPLAFAQAAHVRWDIISLNPTTTPATLGPGGVAFAAASNPNSLTIKLTGSGNFVSPASGGTSSAVTGGGTWATFSSGVMTGSGTYTVVELVSWQLANLQTGSLIDLIDDGPRANGNAVLRIQYSDGSEGVLGVGCHGSGAPRGIEEGVIATKGFVTYWTGQVPMPGVDANRTVFHIQK